MKLLFDQNPSPRLATKLEDHYAASTHVVTHAQDHASDETVWTCSRENGYTLVTKDSVFHKLSLHHEIPPKVVWKRRGNCTAHQIGEILHKHASDIQTLIESSESNFLIQY